MNLAKYIDHTLLKANATPDEITKLCNEAKQYDFMSVCVNPSYVPLAYSLLKDSNVKVCTVIGFPLGQTLSEVKAYEAKAAIKLGASEIDMVINVGMLKANNDKYVLEDIKMVKHSIGNNLVKVIIETCLLSDDEKIRACKLAKEAGADFVKTSTGFSTGGATIHDIELMRKTVGENMGVKASGGIHSKKEALDLINAGASRIGASCGVKIVTE